jgi:hypothetical protein
MPRELGPFAPAATHLLLSLPRAKLWEILDALQRLCDDPNLVALQDEDGEEFIVAADYAIAVTVDDDTVNVLALRKIDAS